MELTRPGRRRLLPGQVRGLGHELVGLHQRQLGEAAEVGLEAPDALLGVHHRVAVAVGALQLHREAVRDHPVAGLPGVDARPRAQHDAREVRADDVVGQVVARGERRDAAVAAQEAERRQRLEDRRPHGVVVDRARHHGDDRLARAQLGRGDLVDVQALPRVLLRGGDAREHVDLVGVHGDAAVVVGHRDSGERIELLGLDRVEDLLHGVGLLPQRCVVSRTLLHSMVNGTTRRNRLGCDRGHRAGSVRESVNGLLTRGLHQLDEHAARVLRVHEVDARAGRAAARLAGRAGACPGPGARPRSPRCRPRGRPSAGCPGPLRSRNLPMAESGRSGASSWIAVMPPGRRRPPTAWLRAPPAPR